MIAGSRRAAVAVASAAVLLAAADTYVIVLALPAIMADVGVGLDQLQQATPIVSGFLLGYVVVMPLLGRLSDLYGRRLLLIACLALFAAGSLVTASAHDLGSVVAGRALQGVGGGGLVPVTLALVADRWPVASRGVPLGVVGGVQELGAVLGPLYGALILSLSTWRTIFWINLPLCAVLVLALVAVLPGAAAAGERRNDWVGGGLALLALGAGVLDVVAPSSLVNDATLGNLYLPLFGAAWLTPLALAAIVLAAGFLVWEASGRTGSRRLFKPAAALEAARRVDWLGACLAAVCLAAVVVTFATGDPSRSALAAGAVWLLPLAGASGLLLVLHQRRTRTPLIDVDALRQPGAYGPLLANLAIGAALMAVLLDVPILARATVYPDSQLGAALVLLRVLVGVPVGAVLGGWLCQRAGNRVVAAAGLALTTAMLALMSRWTATTLADPFLTPWLHPSDPVLAACGVGFGLAIAPVNASMLAAVRADLHGIASALVVVARMVGMLVGISVLTAVGLHAFYVTSAALPSPITLCPHSPLSCPAYNSLATGAIVAELRAVFLGAAVCAGVATLLALTLLRSRPRDAPATRLAHA